MQPVLGAPCAVCIAQKKKKTWSEGRYFLLLISAQAVKGAFTTGSGQFPLQFRVKWAWLTRWLQKGARVVKSDNRDCAENIADANQTWASQSVRSALWLKGRRLVCQMLLSIVSSADPFKEVSIQPCLELWSIFDQTESLCDKGIKKQKTRDYKFWIYDRSATGLTSPRGVHKTQRKAESKQ